MRQQLIQWLIDDIIPEARRSNDPETSILKFANAHNLPNAQVEMLGQLFNTAKTLSHLEKSASQGTRGSSFPIIDVPMMVGKYLQAPTTQYTEHTGKAAATSLPECMRGWQDIALGEETAIKLASAPETTDTSVFAAERRSRNARRDAVVAERNLEMVKQAQSDFRDQSRRIMEDCHQHLRQHPETTFATLETDALALYGDIAAPVMTKLASYVTSRRWKVGRGLPDETKRLIPEYHGFMEKVSALIDLHCLQEAAEQSIKAATPLAPAPTEAARPPIPAAAEPAGGEAKKKDNGEKGKDETAPAGIGAASGGKANGKGGKGGKEEKPGEGFFGTMNKGIDAAAGKGYGLMEPAIQKAIGGGFNSNQQTVDRDFTDARHLATLQRLMHTDEVLSEADPEKVVSVYNTLRETAPSLAGDANVMRVVLRSAIQHDGISPFDLKSFLDTEAARQKTDYNRQLHGTIQYGGGEMGNRPA